MQYSALIVAALACVAFSSAKPSGGLLSGPVAETAPVETSHRSEDVHRNFDAVTAPHVADRVLAFAAPARAVPAPSPIIAELTHAIVPPPKIAPRPIAAPLVASAVSAPLVDSPVSAPLVASPVSAPLVASPVSAPLVAAPLGSAFTAPFAYYK